MKRRIDRLESHQTIQEAAENSRLAALAKTARKKLAGVALSAYQRALKKLSDDELTALCWANEQEAQGIAWSRIPAATLEAIVSPPADEDANLDDIDTAIEALRKEFPATTETPAQFRRRHELIHG